MSAGMLALSVLTPMPAEVPREIDDFARRDPDWRGGGKHGEFGDGAPED